MAESSQKIVRLPGCKAGAACLVNADCIDVNPTDNTFQPGTINWCGVGEDATVYSISPAAPQASTLTLTGPEEQIDRLLFRTNRPNCPFPLQTADICNGKVTGIKMYRQVTVNTSSYVNAPTARGINATSAPVQKTVNAQWVGPEVIAFPADEIRPTLVTNNSGYYFGVPTGTIDGVNNIFTVSPTPVDANAVVVVVDGVTLIAGTDYTISGNTITLATAPACGADVGVYWTDCHALVSGLDVVDTVVCDSISCGGNAGCLTRPSDGCSNLYVLYKKAASTSTTCASSSGTYAVIANYRKSSCGTSMELYGVKELTNVIDPVALYCSKGRLVLVGENGVWSTCGGVEFSCGTNATCDCGGFGAVSRTITGTFSGGIVDAAYSESGGYFVALFGTSGVIRSENGTGWEVVLPDGETNVNQQRAISAAGSVVATGGDGGHMQVATNSGKANGWGATTNQTDAGHHIGAVSVASLSQINSNYAAIYTLSSNGSDLLLSVSDDVGLTWEERNSFSQVPAYGYDIVTAIDGAIVYVQIDNATYRNLNFGCDCEWENISNTTVNYPLAELTLCQNDFNQLFIASPEFSFVDGFNGVGGNVTAGTPAYDAQGGGWIALSGVLNFLGNGKAEFATGGAYVANTGSCNVSGSVTVEPMAGSTGAGLALRNGTISVVVNEAANELQILSGATVVASEALTVTAGSPYQIQANITGPVVNASVSGVSVAWGAAPSNCTSDTQHGVVGATGDVVDSLQLK